MGQPTLYPNIVLSLVRTFNQYMMGGVPRRATITLSSAQVLALNSTPILCVAAPGAGYAIRVTFASAAYDNSSAYDVNQQLALYTSQTYPQFRTIAGFLGNAGAGSPAHQPFLIVTPSTGEDNPINENSALYVYVPGGNPTNGTNTVKLYITYEIIAL